MCVSSDYRTADTAGFPVPKPSDNTNVHVSSPHYLKETLDFSLYSCFRDNRT